MAVKQVQVALEDLKNPLGGGLGPDDWVDRTNWREAYGQQVRVHSSCI